MAILIAEVEPKMLVTGRKQLRIIIAVVLGLLSAVCCLSPASAERIKDIASVEGVRENQLIGFGLVVGLAGKGDKSDATFQPVANMLRKMGIVVKEADIKSGSKNTAAVMVTANLPPFPKPGTKIDVVVSAMADAKTLQGGTLLLAPLKGPDGKVYALAQGPVSIGGYIGGGGGTTVQKNHPTAGKIPDGGMIEVEPPFRLGGDGEVRLFLHRPDFTTASLTAKKINETLTGEYAVTVDPSTIRMKVPTDYADKVVELVSLVEGLDVSIDIPARVVINERTGTVVIGDTVRLAPVAIAHGNLTIEIKTEYRVTQPPSFAPESSRTVVVPEQQVTVSEQKAALVEVSGVTLGDIVRALNALGVTPRDLISILEALKASGALRAQVEII
jgi:flagellar P-ring protein precursor FlgI